MEVEVTQPPVITKDGREEKTGRFAKGNTLRPVGPTGGGRPRKLDAIEVLEAITAEFSLDEIRVMLRKAYSTALKVEDWKGQLEVLRFVYAYAVGKPVQRSISATIEREDFIKLFSGGSAEEVDPAE